LRERLGEDLMRRDGQGLTPTPRALALWPQVRTALAQLEQSLNPGEFEPAHADATFVLAMADATAAELMPGLVDILEREAPGVSMRVLPLSTRNPSAMLEQGLIDMAVGYFPALLAELNAPTPVEGGHALQHQRLFDGQYVCVMRHDHPLATQALDLDTFCQARHLLVSFSGRPFGFVDEALASLGRERHVVLTVNQFFTAGQVVAHSNLLTVLPQHFLSVTGVFERLVVKPLPFQVPTVHVDMVWRKRLRQPHAHQWLRQAVARASQQTLAKIKA
jgi:DNA-binding transcriptional LysR family regulator